MADAVRTRRRPAEVRQLLLDAAVGVFSRKGYAQATTDDIADEAGVAVSVMYRHFKNKSELFREAVLQPFVDFLHEFHATWRSQYDQPWDEWRLMRELMVELYDNLRAHRDAVLGLMSVNGTLEPAAFGEVETLLQQMFDDLRFIGEEESRRRGWFPAEDIELTVRLVLAMVTSVAAFDSWFLPRGRQRPSRDRLLDHMTGLALYGLRRAPCPSIEDNEARPPRGPAAP